MTKYICCEFNKGTLGMFINQLFCCVTYINYNETLIISICFKLKLSVCMQQNNCRDWTRISIVRIDDIFDRQCNNIIRSSVSPDILLVILLLRDYSTKLGIRHLLSPSQ